VRSLRHLLCVVALFGCSTAHAQLEYEVKAAFLYRFLFYVEWPPAAFRGEAEPLVIAVLGSEEVQVALEKVVRGRRAQGRRVEVRSLANGSPPAGAHMVFVANDTGDALSRLGQLPGVLVVSEAGTGSTGGRW
jgi:hypothetical protein